MSKKLWINVIAVTYSTYRYRSCIDLCRFFSYRTKTRLLLMIRFHYLYILISTQQFETVLFNKSLTRFYDITQWLAT